MQFFRSMMCKARSLIVFSQLNNSPGLEGSKRTRLPYCSRTLDHSCDCCDLGCGHDMINYCDDHTKQYASINTNDMNRHKRSDENQILSEKQFFSDLPQPFVEEIPPNED